MELWCLMEYWQQNVLLTTRRTFLYIISGLQCHHSNKIHIHPDYHHFQQLMELLFLLWFLSRRIKCNAISSSEICSVLKQPWMINTVTELAPLNPSSSPLLVTPPQPRGLSVYLLLGVSFVKGAFGALIHSTSIQWVPGVRTSRTRGTAWHSS